MLADVSQLLLAAPVAHPDYAGSALMLLAAGLLLLGRDSAPPGAATVLAFWLALYATSALAEEGLACAGAPPQPALRAGCNPFWDNVSRPLVRHAALCGAYSRC